MKRFDNDKKKNIILIIVILLLILSFNCNCIFINNEKHPWQIYYKAEYKNAFNFPNIIQVFKKENISYKTEDSDTLSILYGKDINIIEKSSGAIVNGYEDYYHMTIYLDNLRKYPRLMDKDDLEDRKPLLEKSMDYIINIIYNASEVRPISLKFEYGRLYI